MCGTIVLCLDQAPIIACTTFQETLDRVNRGWNYLHTTQTHFLQFKYANRLFVKVNGQVHEITVGKCEGTDKEIHINHNIEMMLLNGAFNWYR